MCYIYAPKGMIEDYFQEVVINLWQSFDQFEGRSKHSTWIYRVALYTCISFIRRKGPASISLSFDVSADEDPSLREQLEELHSVISRLGHIDRALIVLWLEGYAYEEIAEKLRLPMGTVKTQIHRARERMCRLIRNDEN